MVLFNKIDKTGSVQGCEANAKYKFVCIIALPFLFDSVESLKEVLAFLATERNRRSCERIMCGRLGQLKWNLYDITSASRGCIFCKKRASGGGQMKTKGPRVRPGGTLNSLRRIKVTNDYQKFRAVAREHGDIFG